MYKKEKCHKCKEFKITEEHHVMRRRNDIEDTVQLCNTCHQWVHNNISEAKKLGLYKEIDGVYRPRKKSPKKWRIKKYE